MLAKLVRWLRRDFVCAPKIEVEAECSPLVIAPPVREAECSPLVTAPPVREHIEDYRLPIELAFSVIRKSEQGLPERWPANQCVPTWVTVRNLNPFQMAKNVCASLEYVSFDAQCFEIEGWWFDLLTGAPCQRIDIPPSSEASFVLFFRDPDRGLHWTPRLDSSLLGLGGWCVNVIISSENVSGFAGTIVFNHMREELRWRRPAFLFSGPLQVRSEAEGAATPQPRETNKSPK
jgi:hypothetical protein